MPTLAEVGLGAIAATGWHGLVAPAGTDPAIIARINAASRAAAKRPDLAERFTGLGVEATDEAPDVLQAAIPTDAVRYAEVVRRFNIRAE